MLRRDSGPYSANRAYDRNYDGFVSRNFAMYSQCPPLSAIAPSHLPSFPRKREKAPLYGQIEERYRSPGRLTGFRDVVHPRNSGGVHTMARVVFRCTCTCIYAHAPTARPDCDRPATVKFSIGVTYLRISRCSFVTYARTIHTWGKFNFSRCDDSLYNVSFFSFQETHQTAVARHNSFVVQAVRTRKKWVSLPCDYGIEDWIRQTTPFSIVLPLSSLLISNQSIQAASRWKE